MTKVIHLRNRTWTACGWPGMTSPLKWSDTLQDVTCKLCRRTVRFRVLSGYIK